MEILTAALLLAAWPLWAASLGLSAAIALAAVPLLALRAMALLAAATAATISSRAAAAVRTLRRLLRASIPSSLLRARRRSTPPVRHPRNASALPHVATSPSYLSSPPLASQLLSTSTPPAVAATRTTRSQPYTGNFGNGNSINVTNSNNDILVGRQDSPSRNAGLLSPLSPPALSSLVARRQTSPPAISALGPPQSPHQNGNSQGLWMTSIQPLPSNYTTSVGGFETPDRLSASTGSINFQPRSHRGQQQQSPLGPPLFGPTSPPADGAAAVVARAASTPVEVSQTLRRTASVRFDDDAPAGSRGSSDGAPPMPSQHLASSAGILVSGSRRSSGASSLLSTSSASSGSGGARYSRVMRNTAKTRAALLWDGVSDSLEDLPAVSSMPVLGADTDGGDSIYALGPMNASSFASSSAIPIGRTRAAGPQRAAAGGFRSPHPLGGSGIAAAGEGESWSSTGSFSVGGSGAGDAHRSWTPGSWDGGRMQGDSSPGARSMPALGSDAGGLPFAASLESSPSSSWWQSRRSASPSHRSAATRQGFGSNDTTRGVATAHQSGSDDEAIVAAVREHKRLRVASGGSRYNGGSSGSGSDECENGDSTPRAPPAPAAAGGNALGRVTRDQRKQVEEAAALLCMLGVPSDDEDDEDDDGGVPHHPTVSRPARGGGWDSISSASSLAGTASSPALFEDAREFADGGRSVGAPLHPSAATSRLASRASSSEATSSYYDADVADAAATADALRSSPVRAPAVGALVAAEARLARAGLTRSQPGW
ncbi:hypothetical protein HK405_006794 [Cladochytrium tenue]|nr:hypothetical protein HK405_006794 [Cladochytrium tenue]